MAAERREVVDALSARSRAEGGTPADDADTVVGQSATTRLLPGTVLSSQMISEDAGVAANQTQLTLSVSASIPCARPQTMATTVPTSSRGRTGDCR